MNLPSTTLIKRATGLTIILTIQFIFAVSAQITDTTTFFRIASMAQAGKSITLVNKDSSVAVQPTLADSPAQLWRWSKGSGTNFRLVNKQLGSELCISTFKEGKDYKLMFSPRKNESGQFWYAYVKNGISQFSCMWLGKEKLLDVTKEGSLVMKDVSMDFGVVLTMKWKQNLTSEKLAVVKPTPTPPIIIATTPVKTDEAKVSLAIDTTGVYRIITQEMPDKSLGIEYLSGQSQAMLVPDKNDKIQEWKLSLNANGFYHINNNYYKSKSLEVLSAGAEGDLVILNTTSDSREQFWKIVLTHEGAYQITCVWKGDATSLDFVEDGEEKNEIRLRDTNSTIWTFIRKSKPVVAPQPVVKQVSAISNKDKLLAGEQLKENAKLISANGEYSLVQQPDGNLVIYNTEKKATWASGMNGQNVKRCVMQKDGNLAQHPGGYDLAMWSTNTKGNAGAYAKLQDDGTLVIVNEEDKIIWSSKN